MKVLGIMGSPRRQGNSDLLLDEVLKGSREGGAEVEKAIVYRMKINPCRECNSCLGDGTCFMKDSMIDMYARLLSSDVVVISSPIFFYGITSQLKAFVDRCQPLWARKYILQQPSPNGQRRGVFIGVGATKGADLFDGSKLVMKYFFRAIDVDYSDNLLFWGIEKRGEIKEHATALADAYQLGLRLVAEQ